jgi:biotin-dependent carboxylase-like uncharacterized protein
MIEVVSPGLFTTFQDRGRFGYRDQGVPVSGAMDQYAAQLSNQLVGNKPEAAVLECTLQGPELYFREAVTIAITGIDWEVELNKEPININQLIRVSAHSTLQLKRARKGVYAYLAVEGGFTATKVLRSYSFSSFLKDTFKLKKGDPLSVNKPCSPSGKQHATIAFKEELYRDKPIKAEAGPEFEALTDKVKNALLQTEFEISKDSNRMAYVLDHAGKLEAREIQSAPVQPGTVQMTPGGKLIVLMRDAQTTGGYARVLQLTPTAINQLAQKRAGEKVGFRL